MFYKYVKILVSVCLSQISLGMSCRKMGAESARLAANWMKEERVEGDLGSVTHSSDAKVQSHECAWIRVHFTALVIAY